MNINKISKTHVNAKKIPQKQKNKSVHKKAGNILKNFLETQKKSQNTIQDQDAFINERKQLLKKAREKSKKERSQASKSTTFLYSKLTLKEKLESLKQYFKNFCDSVEQIKNMPIAQATEVTSPVVPTKFYKAKVVEQGTLYKKYEQMLNQQIQKTIQNHDRLFQEHLQ